MLMRLFIGLEIDEPTRCELQQEVAYLASRISPVKWVVPENLHVTCAFLGEVRRRKVSGVCSLMDEVAGGFSPFTLEIRDLNAFPDILNPKVIYAGCGLGSNDASRLAACLAKGLGEMGLCTEGRPYIPHLTLGRLGRIGRTGRTGLGAELSQITDDAATIQFGCPDIDRLVLYHSEVKSGRVIHTALHHAPLFTKQ